MQNLLCALEDASLSFMHSLKCLPGHSNNPRLQVSGVRSSWKWEMPLFFSGCGVGGIQRK
jgi:hypothetical protein